MTAARILYVEDNAMDVELVRHLVSGVDPSILLRHVSTRADYLGALDEHHYSLILSDNSVGDLTGREALQIAARKCPNTPFVFFTGADIAESGATPKGFAGAAGYLTKRQFSRLREIVREHAARSDMAGVSFQPERATRRLLEAMRDLSGVRSIAEIMAIVRVAIRDLVNADGATFVLREGDHCAYVDEDAIQPLWKGMRFPLESCVSGWSMRHGRQAVIADIYKDPRIPLDAYRPTFVRSLVITPVPRKEPIAAIGAYWAAQHLASEEEAELLQMLGDAAGTALQNVYLMTDLERRVENRTQQLQAANEELSAFSYSISHDLRAPMRAISGFSQILADDHASTLSNAAADCVARVAAEAKRMDALLDDLLRLFSFSHRDLHLQPLDLSAMILACADRLRALEPARDVALVIAPGMQAVGDAGLIGVVVDNLLSNAWKYTGKRAQARIEAGVKSGERGTTFYIADNGVGFDMASADKLFSPFQRLHAPADFAGTGVGVATARRIVRRHGGEMWAEAEPDRGATFSFTLPAAT